MRQVFGGAWTEDKLNRLNKYLKAYTRIFKANAQARYYTTVYVDAFAGTGRIEAPLKANADASKEAKQIKGSAQIALEVEPEFDLYLFIEQNKKRCAELEKLKASYPALSSKIKVENAEANTFLKDWCSVTDWKKTRAVLFLDPFGMQVEWSLLKAIAETHAIDVWFLFPIGMGVNRHLTRKEPPHDEWAERLTRVFGTEDWRTEFYPAKTVATLFGDEETQVKDTSFAKMAEFFVKRLETVFTGVAVNPLLLKTPKKNVPLFLLCFATGSNKPTARAAALRIAENILGKR
jgi:three-Cys-motif partner protein